MGSKVVMDSIDFHCIDNNRRTTEEIKVQFTSGIKMHFGHFENK